MSLSKKEVIEGYTKLSYSVVRGIVRITSARIVANTTVISYLDLKRGLKEGKYDGLSDFRFVEALKKISVSELGRFDHVNTAGLLIYATAIFDTFLTDTTKFLYYLYPDKIAPNKPISWTKLISSDSKGSIINEVINKKCREISFWPFIRRIEYIIRQFGLNMEINDDTKKLLEKYSTLRNVILHDQSLADIQLDGNDKLIIENRIVKTDPTFVSSEDFTDAMKTFLELIKVVYNSISKEKLKASRFKEYKKFNEFLDSSLKAYTKK